MAFDNWYAKQIKYLCGDCLGFQISVPIIWTAFFVLMIYFMQRELRKKSILLTYQIISVVTEVLLVIQLLTTIGSWSISPQFYKMFLYQLLECVAYFLYRMFMLYSFNHRTKVLLIKVPTNKMLHIIYLRLISSVSYLLSGAWLFISYYWVSLTVSQLSQRDKIKNFYNCTRLVTGVYILITGVHALGCILELGTAAFLLMTVKSREKIRLQKKAEDAIKQNEAKAMEDLNGEKYEVSSEGL